MIEIKEQPKDAEVVLSPEELLRQRIIDATNDLESMLSRDDRPLSPAGIDALLATIKRVANGVDTHTPQIFASQMEIANADREKLGKKEQPAKLPVGEIS